MERIATPLEDLDDHYTVVVIGSGYGASVAASRLARAGQRVAVFERGREILPGDYPDTMLEASTQLQVQTPKAHHGDRSSLFSFHVGDDISVLTGCGLGGTSLINANVSLEADPRVFADGWPHALTNDTDGRFHAGVERARAMLGTNELPASETPAKLAALERVGRALGHEARRAPINVTFTPTRNPAGVDQPACTGCGDCVSGCNEGAKNTLLMNYLPDAVRHGASIFTEVDVRHVVRADNRWAVTIRPLDSTREQFDDADDIIVSADVVVLGAGSLGSTEILLRSRAQGLGVSEMLGTHFSGNGDVVGFSYDGSDPVHGVGHGANPAGGRPPVGPTITGVIDLRDEFLPHSMILQEGAVPGAIATLFPVAMATAAATEDVDPDFIPGLRKGAYGGPADHTATFLVMGHDDANGRLLLDDDDERLRILWDGVGDQPNVKHASTTLQRASDALGGRYVANPAWAEDQDHPLVTVHPLGGCPMAEDATRGVVDDRGRVFSGPDGTVVHDGLYVMDAAVIPRSLGVNPLLTITGLAERASLLLAEDRGWTVDFEHVATAPLPEAETESLEFTERMKGWIAAVGNDPSALDYETAVDQGERDGNEFEFLLTIVANDVHRVLADPGTPSVAFGTVTAPALDPQPLTVAGGEFAFWEPADQPDVQHMDYRLPLAADDGREWFMVGHKVIDRGRLRDLWHDTTTLFVDIHSGADDTGPIAFKGVLRISIGDFSHQLRTMTVDNARSESQRLALLAQFGAKFAGNLFDHYGGVFGSLMPLDRDAPPRVKRPLRCGVPEVHHVTTEDDVELQLLRYRGGDRGPVVLVHGMGASSRLFTIDTIATNLTEYLWEQGFDVWLVDWRGSILVPASLGSFDADDCARYDYPATSQRIRELTGADGLHWIAHCVGSITFFMSLLQGLENVKSVVALQVAAHPIPPRMTRLKCGLHVPDVLDHLGINSLSAETYGEGLADRAFDAALRLTPGLPRGERCSSAVCLRCTFLYSLCWRHANLNSETHDAIHEMMGIANMEMMSHLARCAIHGRLLDVKGGDTYLPHFDRLSMPITLIQGKENQVWRQAATQTTYDQLVKQFGPDNYRHHAVPGYGHLDTVFGKDAVRDTYPLMLEHLDRAGA